jgi:O-methyltransferase
VDLRVGPALDSLAMLSGEGAGPFDLIFIDADKPNNPNYLSWAMKLSRPGTVIVCDNVIRDGDVIRKDSPDESVHGARAAFSFIGKDKRLEGTAIQTVGAKGYNGYAIAMSAERRSLLARNGTRRAPLLFDRPSVLARPSSGSMRAYAANLAPLTALAAAVAVVAAFLLLLRKLEARTAKLVAKKLEKMEKVGW